jgi:hypothetical protein
MFPALVTRLFLIGYALITLTIGLLYRHFKEDAAWQDPTSYWFWLGNQPYIEDPDQRVAHVEFRSKVLITAATPILLLGIFTPDSILNAIDILGIMAIIFLSLVIHYIFITDANDRNKAEDEEEKAEELREMEESGKLKN